MSRYKRNTYKKVNPAVSVIVAVCLTLFIFSAAVVIILNMKDLYYLDIVKLNIEEKSGLKVAEIKANYDTLIRYNNLFYQGALKFPTLAMSKHGEIHFVEVKRIFDALQILCMVTLVGSVSGVIFMKRSRDRLYLKITGVALVAVPVILGALAAIDWNNFFVTFHHIFFRNNYWLFDPIADPVINILPDGYFLHCAVGILLLIFVSAVVCLILGWRRDRK